MANLVVCGMSFVRKNKKSGSLDTKYELLVPGFDLCLNLYETIDRCTNPLSVNQADTVEWFIYFESVNFDSPKSFTVDYGSGRDPESALKHLIWHIETDVRNKKHLSKFKDFLMKAGYKNDSE